MISSRNTISRRPLGGQIHAATCEATRLNCSDEPHFEETEFSPKMRPTLYNLGLKPPNDFEVIPFSDLNPHLQEFVRFVMSHKLPSQIGLTMRGAQFAFLTAASFNFLTALTTIENLIFRSVGLGSIATTAWHLLRKSRLINQSKPDTLVFSDEGGGERLARIFTDFELPFLFAHLHTKRINRVINNLVNRGDAPFVHEDPLKVLSDHSAVSIDNDGNLYFTKNPLDKAASDASTAKQIGRIIAWYSPFQRSRSFLKPVERRVREEKSAESKQQAPGVLRPAIAPQ